MLSFHVLLASENMNRMNLAATASGFRMWKSQCSAPRGLPACRSHCVSVLISSTFKTYALNPGIVESEPEGAVEISSLEASDCRPGPSAQRGLGGRSGRGKCIELNVPLEEKKGVKSMIEAST